MFLFLKLFQVIFFFYFAVTSARDKVILNPESARPKWGKPGETILNVLQGVPLAEGTMASNTSGQFIVHSVFISHFNMLITLFIIIHCVCQQQRFCWDCTDVQDEPWLPADSKSTKI